MSDTMTDQEPQAPPAPAPAPSPVKEADGKSAAKSADVPASHTPGGIPAVPAVITTANSVVGGFSGTTLAAGPGAVLATAVGAGMLVAGGVAVASRRNLLRRPGGTRSGQAGRASRGLRSRAAAGGGLRSLAGTGSRARTGGTARGAGRGGRAGGPVSLRKPSATGAARPAASGSVGHAAGARQGGGLRGQAAGVRALRRQQQAAAPTRAGRRQQTTAARRDLADSRRTAKAARRAGPGATASGARSGAGTGGGSPLGSLRSSRAGTKGGRSVWGRVKSVPQAARSAARRHADEAREIRTERAKKARVTARARAKRAAGVMKARLKYAARCVPAAALALPLGVLGLLTTPLGRRLGWKWLMYPGRRLFAAMTGKARADLENDLAAARRGEAGEADDETEISDRVPRDGSRGGEGDSMSAYDGEFGFAEAAAEMEEKAQAFEPDGMMQVLAAIDSFPTGLGSIGNIFKLMTERCDEEYPLDPKVGQALTEVFTLLQQAGEAAEEAGKTFREMHEADIERLEDPRTGEEKWNYTGD